MGRALVAAAAVLALAAPALASAANPRLPSPLPPEPRLSKAEATRIFLANDKVSNWLGRYPNRGRQTEATYKQGAWTLKVWWGAAGEIATGRVDDQSGAVQQSEILRTSGDKQIDTMWGALAARLKFDPQEGQTEALRPGIIRVGYSCAPNAAVTTLQLP